MKTLFNSNLYPLSKIDRHDFRISWLRLARCKNVGPRTFIELIKLFGHPKTALENLNSFAKRGGAKNTILIPSKSSIEEEIEQTEKVGAKIIFACDQLYPKSLLQIPDFPPVIIVKGNIELLKGNKFAIVGARNSSINGIKIARDFSKDIGKAGYIITSGLAKGIDAAAHDSAIDLGTIGVIAGGIDHIYPKENRSLFYKLYEKGLIITEQTIGQTIQAKHFPRRNRIIAGLSLGVLIVEAAKKSGSLITARLAAEYNREVFAIPGSPLDVKCHGTNALIKQGANLVQFSSDIITYLDSMMYNKFTELNDNTTAFEKHHHNTPTESELEKYRNKLVEKISYSPVEIQDILEELDIPINVLNYLFIELELAGRLNRMYGNRVCLIDPVVL